MTKSLGVYRWDGTQVRHAHGVIPGPPPSTGIAVNAGALTVGTASYSIPSSNVIYLSTTGSDANAGTSVGAPKATLQAAWNAMPAGGTVVVRGGVYGQGFTSEVTKGGTIQNYPGEAVWFDGTNVISSWTGSGPWSATLPAQFDHSASFGFGQNESAYINPSFPMAAWPDMVFIDGTRQQQVADTVTPTAGQFHVNYTTNQVTIGTDPSGKEVRVTARGRWAVLKPPTGTPITLRGFGIRRIAASMPNIAAVYWAPEGGGSGVMENMVIEDAAVTALSVNSNSSTIRDCTITRAGMLGVHTNRGQNITFERNIIEGCNVERFNEQPSAAGIKLARAKTWVVRHNVFRNNLAMGLWFDVSCYDNQVWNNLFDGNTGPAFNYEISRKTLFAENWITNSGTSSVWLNDCREGRIWNNVIDRATAFDVRVTGDNRQGSPGTESDGGLQDWVSADNEVCNNVLANYSNKAGTWRLYFSSQGLFENATTYYDRAGGNVWSSPSGSSCSRMATVGRVGSESIYTTPAAFLTAEGSDQIGTNTLAVFTTPSQTLFDSWASAAEPLPADVASLMGMPVGAKVVGPVKPAPIPRT